MTGLVILRRGQHGARAVEVHGATVTEVRHARDALRARGHLFTENRQGRKSAATAHCALRLLSNYLENNTFK